MKSSIFVVMRKELMRFFLDKKLVMNCVLLPGIMIFVMYTFMGQAMESFTQVEDDYKASVQVVNLPDSIEGIMGSADVMEVEKITSDKIEAGKTLLQQEELDLLVVFPEDFDAQVAAYKATSGEAAPNVEMYYNSISNESNAAYDMMDDMLGQYENSMTNKFDINSGEKDYNMASEKDKMGTLFSTMLPMLLLTFLYSGCISVAPESIAGEKERGTITTMLVTPMKRSSLAMGKIAALAIIALLSGLSSTVGTIISMPNLMGTATDEMNANVYGVGEYVLLGITILSTVIFLITIISIISAFAKSVKEAQTAVSPLMIIVIVVGISAMFGSGAQENIMYYLVPLYNSVQAMIGIFSFEIVPMNIIVTFVSNIVYSLAGVFVLTKMFNSEKIMFSR